MNQAQIKYLIARVNQIKATKQQAVNTKYAYMDVRKEMLEEIIAGRAVMKKPEELRKIGVNSYITNYYDYPNLVVVDVAKTRAEENAKITKEATAIIDKLMFPSKDDEYTKELFALIEKFEG